MKAREFQVAGGFGSHSHQPPAVSGAEILPRAQLWGKDSQTEQAEAVKGRPKPTPVHQNTPRPKKAAPKNLSIGRQRKKE